MQIVPQPEGEWPLWHQMFPLPDGSIEERHFAFGPYGLIGPSSDKTEIQSILDAHTVDAEARQLFTVTMWIKWRQSFKSLPTWTLRISEYGFDLWEVSFGQQSATIFIVVGPGGAVYQYDDLNEAEALLSAKVEAVRPRVRLS